MIHKVGKHKRLPDPVAIVTVGYLLLVFVLTGILSPYSKPLKRLESAVASQIWAYGRPDITTVVCSPIPLPLTVTNTRNVTVMWKTWSGVEVTRPYRHSEPRYDLARSPYGDMRWNPITDDLDWRPFVPPGLGYYYGTVHAVDTNGELTTALGAVVDHDIIEIPAGVTLSSSTVFTLQNRSDSGWVLIRTDQTSWLTSTANDRAATGDISNMPTLHCTSSASFFQPAQSARGYDFRGIHFTKDQDATDVAGGFIFWNASPQTQVSHQPTYLYIDKCLFINPNSAGAQSTCRRGLALTGEFALVERSQFLRFAAAGQDSQGIAFNHGVGKWMVNDCTVEAASENIMCGGSPQSMGAAATCADAYIRYCYFPKTAADLDVSPFGSTQKNFMELKHGTRWVWDMIECDHFIGTGQSADINMGSKPQNSGEQAFVVVVDVLIRYIRFNDSAAPLSFHNTTAAGGFYSGLDGTRKIEIAHCLWQNNTFSSLVNRIQVGAGASTGVRELNDIVLRNINTTAEGNAWLFFGPSAAVAAETMRRFTFINSINNKPLITTFGPLSGNGAVGSNDQALNIIASSPPDWNVAYLVSYNRTWGSVLGASPHFCSNAGSLAGIGFVDEANNDYTLDPSSPYKNQGTDGNDPGPYMAGLTGRLSGVTS